MTRKRKIDKAKADEFLQASADSDDDEEDLKRVFDWMDPIAVKRTAIALEDRNAKRMRLKEEGITHAEDGRYWEAVKKWEVALSLSGFYQKHFPNRGSVSVNGGDEEKGKNERLALKQHTQIGNDAGFSEDRILDAQLLEMKAQALMELDEVFPAVQAAEAAVLSHPAWHIGWRTLGRAQLGFGDVDIAIKSFSKAIHLKPDDEECRKQDLEWAMELKEKRSQPAENDSARLLNTCGKCHRDIPEPTSSDVETPS